MSQPEQLLADTAARFRLDAGDGGDWTSGRVLLSNHRLLLVGGDGKRSVPLTDVRSIRESTADAGGEATRLVLEEDVLSVATSEQRTFEVELCAALLDGRRVLVAAGSDATGEPGAAWDVARLRVDGERVRVTAADAAPIDIRCDRVESVTAARRTVRGRERRIVTVAHGEGDDLVETRLTGGGRTCSALETFLATAPVGRGRPDLDEEETQVLLALYSGVSPFAVPEFTGVDVDAVEDAYGRLVERNLLDEVRRRREVRLTDRGRNLASAAMNGE